MRIRKKINLLANICTQSGANHVKYGEEYFGNSGGKVWKYEVEYYKSGKTRDVHLMRKKIAKDF